MRRLLLILLCAPGYADQTSATATGDASLDDTVVFGTVAEFYSQGRISDEQLATLLGYDLDDAGLLHIQAVMKQVNVLMMAEWQQFMRKQICITDINTSEPEELAKLAKKIDVATRRRQKKNYRLARVEFTDDQRTAIESWIDRNRRNLTFVWLVDIPEPRETIESMCINALR